MISLPENAAHVWLVDQRQVTEELLKIYPEVLSPEEMQRLEQIAHPEIKRAQLISRAAIRYCLSQYEDGVAPHHWQFARGEKGKPCLKQPAPLPLSFNLSHSGHWLTIAIIAGAEIGVDLQEHRETASTLKMAQRYFHPEEVQQLQACACEERRELFYRLWTLKEAFLKARGTGIVTGLEKVHFRFGPGGAIEATIAIELNEHSRDWSFSYTHLDKNYSLALAVQSQSSQARPRFFKWVPGSAGQDFHNLDL